MTLAQPVTTESGEAGHPSGGARGVSGPHEPAPVTEAPASAALPALGWASVERQGAVGFEARPWFSSGEPWEHPRLRAKHARFERERMEDR
jgi:hypothetical protein